MNILFNFGLHNLLFYFSSSLDNFDKLLISWKLKKLRHQIIPAITIFNFFIKHTSLSSLNFICCIIKCFHSKIYLFFLFLFHFLYLVIGNQHIHSCQLFLKFSFLLLYTFWRNRTLCTFRGIFWACWCSTASAFFKFDSPLLSLFIQSSNHIIL